MEAYLKNFLDFICGSPTNIEVSNKDKKIEAGPDGIVQEEEVQTEESHDLRSGAT